MEWVGAALSGIGWLLSQPWFQGLTALLGLLGTAAFAWCIWRLKRLQAQLADRQDRARIKAALEAETTPLERYTRNVGALNARIRAFYGAPFSWTAFERSLLVAIVYPLLLFLVAWVVGGVGTIGDIILLPDLEFGGRSWLAGLLMLASAMLGFWHHFLDQINDTIEVAAYRVFRCNRDSTPLFVRKIIRGGAAAAAVVSVIAGVGAISLAGAGVGAVAVASALT
ncbi:MAG: hypothetical protein ACRC56_06320, partial [Bosea sp. (in: a-proteobacteria)]